MTSTLAYEHNFAEVISVNADKVELAFDLNRERWPWLSLPPQHPVLVGKYQYFSSITAGEATGMIPPGKFTALTHAEWQCPELADEVGYATHGVCLNTGMGFDLSISDEAGHSISRFKGQGAIIDDRDFMAWRLQTRNKALAAGGNCQIDMASPTSLGMDKHGVSYVSALRKDHSQPRVEALVGTDTGFYPDHPFHTGSGDHVNVAHLVDCALQMAHLVLESPQPLTCTGGAAQFQRFIELDVPFSIMLESQDAAVPGETRLTFAFSQLGKDNTHITLQLKE